MVIGIAAMSRVVGRRRIRTFVSSVPSATQLPAPAAALFVIIALAITFPTRSLAANDVITLFTNASDVLPGQRLSFGLSSLSRSTAVDVYLGMALPDGSLVFFDGSGAVALLGASGGLNQMPKLASFPPGATQSTLQTIYLPTVGLGDETYQLQLFIASLIAGGLQDNVLGPGKLLAFDARPITFSFASEPRFEFEASISGTQRALIQDSVAQTQNLLGLLGAPDVGAVTIFVAETLEGVGQAYAKRLHISPEQAIQQKATVTGEGGYGFVFLKAPISGRTGVYHELFHVLQNRLTHAPIFTGDFVPIGGPTWLIEGAAVYFQDVGGAHYGAFDFTAVRNANLQSARRTSALRATLETRTGILAAGTDTGYALGFAAVDFLLNGAPVSALLAFWERIGQGHPWPEAFTQTFGSPVRRWSFGYR